MFECDQNPIVFTRSDRVSEDFDGILTLFSSNNDILDYIMIKEGLINGQET